MIEIKDLVVKYSNFEAVKGVSFTVSDGEFFTLLGPSGCGKTTTLRAISGFEEVSSGSILLDGKDISALSPEERGIGYVFQNYALFPTMSVFDNIAFGLKIKRLNKKQIREEVNQIAELIGITEHLEKKISQISGGQQQRVAIARALVMKPRLLLMDEPLSNLDAKLRVSMRGEIKRIQKELGIVAIYVTHDQEEAMAVSDKIAVFNSGLIEQIGSPQEIYYQPKTEFAAKFVGDINDLGGGRFLRTEKLRIFRASEENVPAGKDDLVIHRGVVQSCEFLGATSKITVALEDGSVLKGMEFDISGFSAGDKVFAAYNKTDVLNLC